MSGRSLPSIATLRAFEAVGRLGGIRRAARELHIDHAVVGRHLRTLEHLAGTPLLLRKDGDSLLTHEGSAYHEAVSAALTMIANATEALTPRNESLSLTLWCIPGFASLWLADRLNDFIANYPNIDVDFRPTDNVPDFRGREVDGDVRYARDWEVYGLPRIVRRFDFARPPVFPVASPKFLASIRPIESAADFLALPLLHEENDLEWAWWLRHQRIDVRERLPGSRFWNAHISLNAARQGQGIALANQMLLKDDVREGRLLEVTPSTGAFDAVALGSYAFMAREDRWNTQAIALFRRWLHSTVTNDQKMANAE